VNWSILFNLFSRIASAGFGLVISIVISRELGAEIKGDHALFVVGVSIIHLFTNLFGGASLGYLAPRHSIAFLVRLSTLWSLLSGGICGAILWFLGLLPEGFEWYIIVSGILFACWNSYVTLLLGRQYNKAYNIIMFINPLMSAGFLLILLYTIQHNLYAFANGYTLAQSITLVVSFVWIGLLPDEQKNTEKKDWKALFKHGIYIQLANLTQFLNYRILFYLIDDFFGRAFLGVYSNALALAESVWMVSKSISTVQFSKIVNSNSDEEARAITRKYIPISGVVSAIGISLLLLIPAPFFTFLFGRDFSEVSQLMLWLSPAILAMSMGNIYAHYFAGKGLNHINFIGSLINLVVLVALFFIGKPFLDQLTAPFSASVSFVLTTVYTAFMYHWGKDRYGHSAI
jgi:O-antigen/teichoic acid export membrane protein